VVRVLRALVEHYADRPNTLPFPDLAGTGHPSDGWSAGSDQAVREAVTYVAGMTDRFAFTQAVARLGWDPASLPTGLDVAIGR
jgi:dGTPase